MKTNGGRIQAYIGNGKGKTTATLGLALRALGQGYSVAFLQFLKKGEYGELKAFDDFVIPEYKLKIRQFGTGKFVAPDSFSLTDIKLAEKGMLEAHEAVTGSDYNIVILDEVLDTVEMKILEARHLLELVESRPEDTELILTGRDVPNWLEPRMHLISRIDAVKHPFKDEGLKAREGIEF